MLNVTGEPYKHNVSNIIDNLVANRKKVFHLNFTKLIHEKDVSIKKKDYKKDDPGSHLNPSYYGDFFIKKIIDYVFNNLNT